MESTCLFVFAFPLVFCEEGIVAKMTMVLGTESANLASLHWGCACFCLLLGSRLRLLHCLIVFGNEGCFMLVYGLRILLTLLLMVFIDYGYFEWK